MKTLRLKSQKPNPETDDAPVVEGKPEGESKTKTTGKDSTPVASHPIYRKLW